MTVRKNQAQLTATEKRRFVDALLALKRNGQYDTFVTTHNAFIMSDTDNGDRVGHRSPSFLPWHRRFLHPVRAGASGRRPFGGAPVLGLDRGPHRRILALGGRLPRRHRPQQGRPGDGGPFAFAAGRWPVNVRVDGRGFLRRDLGAGGRQLPTRAEVDSVLAMTTYDARAVEQRVEQLPQPPGGLARRQSAQPGARLGRRSDGHRRLPERPGVLAAPRLHRQALGRLAGTPPRLAYLPAAGTANVVDLNDTMRPWNDVTPADMLDHTPHYTFDTAA